MRLFRYPAPPAPPREPDAGGFAVGSPIEARYRGKRKWYPGTIAKVNGDGTYDIQYVDGDSERGVTAQYVRAAGEPAPPAPPREPDAGGFAVGSPTEVR